MLTDEDIGGADERVAVDVQVPGAAPTSRPTPGPTPAGRAFPFTA